MDEGHIILEANTSTYSYSFLEEPIQELEPDGSEDSLFIKHEDENVDVDSKSTSDDDDAQHQHGTISTFQMGYTASGPISN
ncbi:hypothetical protein GQ457_02G021440 [Hibiscus cannabinus]